RALDWATQSTIDLLHWSPPPESPHRLWPTYNLTFTTHFHPYVCAFIKVLNRTGIPGLLTLDNQRSTDLTTNNFVAQYAPTEHVDIPYPLEAVDFNYGDAYAIYNWELFIHTVMLITMR